MFFFVCDSKDGFVFVFFFQAEDGIRDGRVTGVQTCALPISSRRRRSRTRSCRSCLGGQRGLYLAAAALDVAAGPVPYGQRFATAGSAPLAGGVDGAGGPARSGAADHRVSSGQA